MRILIEAIIPNETGNAYAKDGSLGTRIEKVLADLKPEAAYFLERDGKRCAIMVVHANDSSDLPRMAEPFFLQFNAEAHFHICMGAEDLAKADVPSLGKKWG